MGELACRAHYRDCSMAWQKAGKQWSRQSVGEGGKVESIGRLAKWIPLLQWLPSYQRSWLRGDIIAGLTVWALVVPQAIAYAQIAGLPPQAGVFASFAAPLGYAIFGTSRQLIVSPTSATAAISAALVAPLAVTSDPGEYATLSAGLAVLCGLLFLLLGRFKLGFLSQFIAPSVQAGFLVGLGLTIMVGQLCKVLGISSEDGPFYQQAWHVLQSLGETNGWTLALGGAALVALFVIQRIEPRIPSALLLVVASIALVSLFNLDERGVEVVGNVDRAIPIPKIPILAMHDLAILIPGTFAIVVIGYSESISVARGFADKHHYRLEPNKELTALGVSSIAGGLFQGFITGGGASQSAANDRAGARTPVAAIVLSALAFLSAILLMPLFRNLPQAVLGAIVINAVVGFVNIAGLRRIHGLRSDSFWLSITALAGVLVLGILPGLLLTVMISILLLLGALSRPTGARVGRSASTGEFVRMAEDDDTHLGTESGLLIYRPDAPILFVNASWEMDRIREEIERQPVPPRVVVLDLAASGQLDVSGLDMLASLHRELAHTDQELWISEASPAVTDLIGQSDLADTFSAARVFQTNRDAWEAYRRRYSGKKQDQGGVDA